MEVSSLETRLPSGMDFLYVKKEKLELIEFILG